MALSCSSFDKTRCPWGNLGPGEGPDTPCSSYRWRCPGGKRGPTRASARFQPPSTTKLSASEYRRTDLSTPTPSSPPDRHTRGQSGANAQVRREPAEGHPVLVGKDSEQPPYISKPARMRRFCAKRFFLLDRPRPVLFLSRTKREWGVDCPASILASAPVPLDGSHHPKSCRPPQEIPRSSSRETLASIL